MQQAQWLNQGSKADNPEEDVTLSVASRATQPYQVVIEVNGRPITMKIDTDAAVSIISKKTWEKRLSEVSLSKATLCLCIYTAEKLTVLGELTISVRYGKYGRGQKKLT